jgi:hypothetical protein
MNGPRCGPFARRLELVVADSLKGAATFDDYDTLRANPPPRHKLIVSAILSAFGHRVFGVCSEFRAEEHTAERAP